MTVETFEERIVPVVGHTAVGDAPLVDRGVLTNGLNLDGVVRMEGSGHGTGAYLFTGRHVLSAAHVTRTDKTVRFELARDTGAGAKPVDVVIEPQTGSVVTHPNYQTLHKGNDISVEKLLDPEAPERFLVGPFIGPNNAGKYELHENAANDVGQLVTFSGYGFGGTGVDGQTITSPKRWGQQTLDKTAEAHKNEIRTVKITGTPTKGNFTLTIEGINANFLNTVVNRTTNPIPFNANADDIQNALRDAFDDNTKVNVYGGAATDNILFVEFEARVGLQITKFTANNAGLIDAQTGNQKGNVELTLRIAGNKFVASEKAFLIDFDKTATPIHDALGVYHGPDFAHPGVANRKEAYPADGDSGAPYFLNGRIVGVESGGGGDEHNIPDIDKNKRTTFGEVDLVTRVSSYANNFLRDTLFPEKAAKATPDDGRYHITLDMNYQVLGARTGTGAGARSDTAVAGENVTITAKMSKNGDKLELHVDGPGAQYNGLYFSEDYRMIKSLTIRGSDDNETFIIAGDLKLGGTDGDGTGAFIGLRGREGDDKFVIGFDGTGNLDDWKYPTFISGNQGNDEVIVNDLKTTTGNTYTVGKAAAPYADWDGRIERQNKPAITHWTVEKVTLNTGPSADKVNITAAAEAVTKGYFITTWQGEDKITVDGFTDIKAKLFIDGDESDDELIINDFPSNASAMNAQGYTLGAASAGGVWQGEVKRADREPISYQAIQKVSLSTGKNSDNVTISETNSIVRHGYHIDVGEGLDEVNVGGSAGKLDGIKAPLYITTVNSTRARLHINDANSGAERIYQLYRDPWVVGGGDGQVHRTDVSVINHFGVKELILDTGVKKDVISVAENEVSSLTLNSGNGDDAITIGSVGAGLDLVKGYVKINAGGGINSLKIDDGASANKHTYVLHKGSKLERDGVSRISWSDVTVNDADLTRSRKPGNDVTLRAWLPGHNFNLFGGGGNDIILVSDVNNRLDDIRGTLSIYAGGPQDRLTVADTSYASAETYSINANTVTTSRLTDQFLRYYNGFSFLALNTGYDSDGIDVSDLTAALHLAIDGGYSTDTVRVHSGEVYDPDLISVEELKLFGGITTILDSLQLLTLVQTGGVLDGSGTVMANTTVNWTGGTMKGPGETVAGPNAVLTITGPVVLENRTLRNGGTGTWTGTIYDGPNGPGTLHNTGKLHGTGTLYGILEDHGKLYPGGSANSLPVAGTITVNGPYTEAGTLHFDLGAIGSSSDRINAATVTLGGSLALNALGSPLAASYILIDNTGSDAVSDTFVGLPEGAIIQVAGKSFHISYVGGTGNDVVLNAVTTTTTVTASPTPSVFGQSVTLTATVAAVAPLTGTPTGTVEFRDGTTLLGTASLNASAQATFVVSTLSVGTHSIVANYLGASSFPASSGTTSHVANKANVTTSVVSGPSPSTPGETVTIGATVHVVSPGAGTPTGTITFFADGTTLGAGSIDTNGFASLQTSSLAIGTHAITATYGGDSNFNGASGATSQIVGPVNTTTTVSTAPNPSIYGNTVVISATVNAADPAAGTPTGLVTFYVDGNVAGGNNIDASGQVSISVSTLSAGTHNVEAKYAGEGHFDASSNVTSHLVNKAPTTMTVVAAPSPSVYGQSFTLVATVSAAPSAGTPTGMVTFYAGSSVVGSSSLVNGVASINVNNLSAGMYAIAAVYAGNANLEGSTGNNSHVVNRDQTTTIVTSAPDPSVFGQLVTISATVSGTEANDTPTGTVTFYAGTNVVGTATLDSDGEASVSVSSLSVGSHTIIAEYAGDANFEDSSDTDSHQVNNGNTVTTVTSAPNPSVVGQNFTLYATVAADAPASGVPSGSIVFYIDGTAQPSVPLDASGSASLPVSGLAVGTYAITTSYAGDNSFNASNGVSSHLVIKGNTTTTITSSPNPCTFGQTITISAAVSVVAPASGVPSGLVRFYQDNVLIASDAIDASGNASITVSTMTAGSHQLTAEYEGDDSFLASSATTSQTVDMASTTTDVSSSPNPSVYGQIVTISASVSSANGIPSGYVSFFAGLVALGNGWLDSNGNTSLDVSNLPVDTYIITAIYSGDENYATSSDTTSQTVNRGSTQTSVVTSPNPSERYGVVTLTASVIVVSPASGNPSGDVTFYADTVPLGSGSVDAAGNASITVSSLSVGWHQITAEYGGDGHFEPSSGTTYHEVVKASTFTYVSSYVNPSVYGEDFIVTAFVGPTGGIGMPTGTVEFWAGSTSLGSGTLDASGIAAVTVDVLAVDIYTITATYGGDDDFDTSTGTHQHEIQKGDTTTVLTVSPSPSVYGQSITISAAVSATSPAEGVPSGTVSFYSDGVAIGSDTLDANGNASISLSNLSVATHNIRAEYEGDDNFNASDDDTDHVVNKGNTTTSVNSSPSSVYGQSITISASVSALSPAVGVPTGTLVFFANNVQIGSGTLNASGNASITISSLNAGVYSFKAEYQGDANFNASDGTSSHTINKADTETVASSVPNPSAYGQTITVSTTVTTLAPGSGIPTGSVWLNIDGNLIDVVPLDPSGNASMSVSGLSVGSHSISVGYYESTNFKFSFGSVTHVVSAPANLPPDAYNDNYTTGEETLVTGDVLANDDDSHGGLPWENNVPMTAQLVSGPSHAASFTLNSNGTFNYTPAEDFSGTDTFSYTATDSLGGVSSIATVTIDVIGGGGGGGGNSPPDPTPDTSTTPETTSVTIAVLANDTDVDGDTLIVVFVGPAGHGTTTLNPDGTVTYVPEAGFTGLDAFNYSVSDGFHTVSEMVSVLVQEGDPQRFDGEAVTPGPDVQTLTAQQLAPLVQEAIRRWTLANADPSISDRLNQVDVRIAQLNGELLGLAGTNTIWLDINAAGHGWFIDATPTDDVEFSARVALHEARAVDGEAAQLVDLLAVVCHELGHILGLEDLDTTLSPHELMSGTLGLGTRRFADGYASPLLTPQTEQRGDLLMATLTLAPTTRAAEPLPDETMDDAIWLLAQGQNLFSFNENQVTVPLLPPQVAIRPAQDEHTLSSSLAGGGEEVLVAGEGDSILIGQDGHDLLVGGFASDALAVVGVNGTRV